MLAQARVAEQTLWSHLLTCGKATPPVIAVVDLMWASFGKRSGSLAVAGLMGITSGLTPPAVLYLCGGLALHSIESVPKVARAVCAATMAPAPFI